MPPSEKIEIWNLQTKIFNIAILNLCGNITDDLNPPPFSKLNHQEKILKRIGWSIFHAPVVFSNDFWESLLK